MWDSHSPILPQAVPSQPLHPTDLQYSHGLSSASWSFIEATVYQPLCDMPSFCVWSTGPQSRREGLALPNVFPQSTYLSSLSMSQGFLYGTQLTDYHQLCTLNVHLSISHKDVGSPEVLFHLWASIFPSTTSTDMKNHLAQGSHFPQSAQHKEVTDLLKAPSPSVPSWPDSFSCSADPSSTKPSL